MHPLVARIEPPGMPDHAGQSGFFLLGHHRLGISPAVGKWNFDLNMLACCHAGHRLGSMHLRCRAQDYGIDIVPRQCVSQMFRAVPGTVFCGSRGCLLAGAADDRDDFDPVDEP